MNYLKYIKRIVLALMVALALASCEQFLITEPNDKIYLNDNFSNTYDIDNAARGMYDGLQACVEKMFVWAEVRSDLVWPGTGANWEIQELNDLNVSSTNSFTDWSEFYDVINRANYIIKYASKVEELDHNFTEEDTEQFVAEAINVRSLCYFWLVRTFGDVPLILEPYDENHLETKMDTVVNADGTTEVVELPVYYVDPTYSETILDTLESQLERVEGIERLYSNEFSDDNNLNPTIYSSRFKAITNLVLQADIKLWRHKFEEAYDLSSRAFAFNPALYNIGDESGAPVCFSGSNYVQRWIDIFTGNGSLTPETIFEIRFQTATPDLNILQNYTAFDPADGGSYLVRPSQKAIDYWQNDEYYFPKNQIDTCDIFRGYNASFAGEYDTLNQEWINPYIFKYLVDGTDGFSRSSFESDCNWIIYRMADVLCIRSEAYNRMGEYAKAIYMLQGTWDRNNIEVMGLRSRVLLKPYLASTDVKPNDPYEMEGIILEERAKELAFEGKRWFDMVRIAQRKGQFSFFLDEVELSAPIEKKAFLRERAANPENWFLPYNENAKKYFVNPDYQNKTIETIKNNLGI